MHDLGARAGDQRRNLPQELEARDAEGLRVARREVPAEITEPESAEQRVADCVRDHIGIRVPGEPERVIEPNAAQHEGPPRLEPMDVVADPRAGQPFHKTS
jgi:hypothetical protein